MGFHTQREFGLGEGWGAIQAQKGGSGKGRKRPGAAEEKRCCKHESGTRAS